MLKSSALLNSFFMSSQPALQGKTLSSGSKLTASTTAPGDNLFARLLAKTTPGAVSGGNSQARSFSSAGNNMSVAATKPKGGDKEVSITAILESAFINQGIFPDKVVLSQKDFDFLGNVLEDMGFSRSRLKSFFEEIKENRSGDLITLSHFLQDLSAFEQTEDRKASLSASSLTDSIDKSAVPHLELILRDLGVPPEKMASLLSTAARETGAIDIEKLVLQLKTYSHAKEKNSSAVQVAGKDKIAKDTKTNGLQPDSSTMKKMASGLEKLGLSVPDKASHLPFTLEMFIQSLEKKVGETTSVSKNTPLELTRKAESVLEMPAVKAMKMQKTETYFGFAREMMIDKLNKPTGQGSAAPKVESQNLLSANKDAFTQEHKKAGPRISAVKVPGEKTSFIAETNRQSVQIDILKMDGAGPQENHQTLMPGGEKLQGSGISLANVAENLSTPIKQTAVFQQNPLPAAVVNQVGKEIAAFLHRGDRIFTLQLKPPELGMVNIEMDVKENVLKMSVVTETSSAKDMLHANYVDLKRVLEGYGIRVETFDVQLNSNLNQNSSNGEGLLNQQHHSHGRFGKNGHSGKPGRDTADDGKAESTVSPQKNNEFLLDLLA